MNRKLKVKEKAKRNRPGTIHCFKNEILFVQKGPE